MIARFSIKNIKLLLAIYFAVVCFFGGSIIYRMISDATVIDNSVAIWFMQDDPELKIYDTYNKDFGEKEWTVLMLKTNSIYSPQFLSDLSEITNSIENLEHIIKVNSIANIRDNVSTEDGFLNYKQVLPEKKILTKNDLQNFKIRLASNPIFENSLIQHKNDSTTIILIQNDNLIRHLEPYRITMVDSIQNIISRYSSVSNHALAGTTVVNAELNRSSKQDVIIFYTLITVMLIIFGWFSMRSIKNIIAMLVVVVGSLVPSMGLLALLHIPYNMATVMVPTILIALSVADVIHVIEHFHDQRKSQSSKEAIVYTIQHLWKPGLYTTITTLVGFSSFAFSTVSPIFQLGMLASFGIVLAYAITMIIIPGLLVLLFPHKLTESNHSIKKAVLSTEKLPVIVEKYKIINGTIFLLLLFLLYGIFYLQIDTNYTKFFNKNTHINKSYSHIEENNFAQNPITIILKYPDGTDYTSSKYFSKVIDFEKEIKNDPEVIKLLSVNDLLFETDKAFSEEKTSSGGFINYDKNKVAQLLVVADMSNNDDIYDFLLYDKSQIQIQVLTKYMSSNELNAFKNKLIAYKENHLPEEIDILFTGTTVLWANMDAQINKTQLYSLVGVTIFLLIFFPIIFGSFKLGMLGVIANMLPIAFTYGLMGFFGVEINMATAIFGGISLGIVTDDTIHMILGFKEGIKNGLSPQKAMEKTLKVTGKSILMTSIILIGSFLTMTTSNFLPTSNFGIIISLCIAIALFIDLMILPIVITRLKI